MESLQFTPRQRKCSTHMRMIRRSLSIQLWCDSIVCFFVFPGSTIMCRPSRSMCGGRKTVKTQTFNSGLYLMWPLDPPLCACWQGHWRSPSAYWHFNHNGKWETGDWTHIRFYTPAKSDFTLLEDRMSFILIFWVRIGIGHVSGFWLGFYIWKSA